MTKPSSLLASTSDDVLTLTLNRPQARNALDAELIAALTQAFVTVPAHIRTVVLCGTGVSFCAGADLSWMRATADTPNTQTTQTAQALQNLFVAMTCAPQVVVAVAQGPVRGGGAGLLCAADVVLAGHDLTVAFPEAALGLVPAVIAPFVVERIGMAQARYLFLTSEVVDAQAAKGLGLIHEVAAVHELPTRLAHVLARLHHNGPRALAATKELLRAMGHPLNDELLRLCARTLDDIRAGAEAQEGCAAFLQRRSPTWRRA